jgi:hypothetical protein
LAARTCINLVSHVLAHTFEFLVSDHDPHRTIYYLGYPLGRFVGLKHRQAQLRRRVAARFAPPVPLRPALSMGRERAGKLDRQAMAVWAARGAVRRGMGIGGMVGA